MKKALEEQKAKKEEAKSKPKKSIADDIEKLKNRREDRKKYDEDKKTRNDGGGKCDNEFENLIKKKKLTFVNTTPENVNLQLLSTSPAKTPKSSFV